MKFLPIFLTIFLTNVTLKIFEYLAGVVCIKRNIDLQFLTGYTKIFFEKILKFLLNAYFYEKLTFILYRYIKLQNLKSVIG